MGSVLLVIYRGGKSWTECRDLDSRFAGKDCMIPRVKLDPYRGSLRYVIRRRLFPGRLCFATVINQSQGQVFLGYLRWFAGRISPHMGKFHAASRARGAQQLCDIVYLENFN